MQRKKKAQEELQQQLKEERKRLKKEAKESYKKLVVSHRPIPEIEELLKEEYEEDNVTVKVVELSSNDVSRIGPNRMQFAQEAEEVEEEEEVPGMDLKPRRKKEEVVEFKTDKDVKKALKKQAVRNVKKSKVFQKKNQIEKRKQKKKSLQQKKRHMKFTGNKAKHKGQNKKKTE